MSVWLAVFVIIAGFIAGGFGVIFTSLWVFVGGLVLIAVGGLAALRGGIMENTH